MFKGVVLCDEKDSLDPNDAHDAKLLAQSDEEPVVVPRKDRKKKPKSTKPVDDTSDLGIEVRSKKSQKAKG